MSVYYSQANATGNGHTRKERMMDEGKFTGLKYDEDCGFYAVHDGKIISPESGISGDKGDALKALFYSTYDTYRAYDESLEARKSALETFCAARELLESHAKEMERVQLAATGTIDWRTVEPLDADEKCVSENPAYLSIPF
jgi:hypothetical protein